MVSSTAVVTLTLQCIHRGIRTTSGERHRQVAGAAEEVAEEGDAVGDVDGAIVVTVGGFFAADAAPCEEIIEGGDGIADVDASIAIHIAADERGFLTLIRNAVAVGIGSTASDIAAVEDGVIVAVVSGGLIEIALIQNSIAIDIHIARVNRAVAVAIDLADVILAVDVAVVAACLVDVTIVGESIAVDVVITGIDGAIAVGVGLAMVAF